MDGDNPIISFHIYADVRSVGCSSRPFENSLSRLVINVPNLVLSAPRMSAAPRVESRAIFVRSAWDRGTPSGDRAIWWGQVLIQHDRPAVVLDSVDVAFQCLHVVAYRLCLVLPAVKEVCRSVEHRHVSLVLCIKLHCDRVDGAKEPFAVVLLGTDGIVV